MALNYMPSFLSAKKLLIFGFIITILVAIPLSVYVVQQQQEIRSQAAASTTLSFAPPQQNIPGINQPVNFDIILDPTNGTSPNEISFAKLVIDYDPAKLSIAEAGLVSTKAFSEVFEGPFYNEGQVSVTLSVGPYPLNVIREKTKIATISFKTLEPTDSTAVSFATDTNETQVLSVGSKDRASENVLLSTTNATLVITNGSNTPTPDPDATPGPTSAPIAGNVVCSSLNLDRSLTGNAPYSITFTAVGNATNSTITKASFNFGDGPVEEETQGGKLGTNSVNVQKAHTYNNPGTYTTTVAFTDSNNNVSAEAPNCTKTITVLEPGATIRPLPTGTEETQITPTETAEVITPIIEEITPTPISNQISPTGPSDKLIGIGILGAIISIIGGIIFLSL